MTTQTPVTWLTVSFDPEDDYTAVVTSAEYDDIEERVDLSPTPAWPSPSEANDAIAEAVRRVLDRAWEAASGEPVIRDA